MDDKLKWFIAKLISNTESALIEEGVYFDEELRYNKDVCNEFEQYLEYYKKQN